MTPGTKVEYKGETLIAARQGAAESYTEGKGMSVCGLCPLRHEPQCNNGPYECYGVVWMTEKDFVIMELTQ